MRWHQIITERPSGFIPDFKQFVTPALIAHLLQTGIWSPHGSSLDDWWDEAALDYWGDEDEGLAGVDFDFARTHDRGAVERILHRFLIARAGWIYRTFTSGDHGITPMTLDSPIQRAICVNDQWIAAMGQPQGKVIPLGIFWGLETVEPWGANDEVMKNNPHVIEIVTQLKHVQVNWYETFISRLDFINGDMEHEIQLEKGSRIAHVDRMFFHGSNTRPDLARSNAEISIHATATFIA